MSWKRSIGRFFKTFVEDRSGVSAVIAVMSLTAVTGMAAFALDIGHVMVVKRQIQASADAAALAGAAAINCCATSQAATQAIAYSSVTGGSNPIQSVKVSMVSGYPKVQCLNAVIALGVGCNLGVDKGNAMAVTETASIPTFFAQMVGVPSITVTASAVAATRGTFTKNYDVMIVMDTTPSMGWKDINNSGCSGTTKMACALAGMQALLNGLQPSGDSIGLATFPGLPSTTPPSVEWTCNTPATGAAYNAKPAPVYSILPLSNDYRVSDISSTLNPASHLAQAAGATNCGMQNVTNMDTYYADSIDTAAATLTANGRGGAQKVIIFISDGDANSTSAPAAKIKRQCQEGVTEAQAATKLGIWVYAIAYDSPNNLHDSTGAHCPTDTGGLTPCQAMQQIASDPSKFYSDTTNLSGGCVSSEHSVSEMISVFSNIANQLLPPRLLSPNTT